MKETFKNIALISPALITIAILFGGGVLLGFTQSLGYVPAASNYNLSFKAYSEIVNNPGFFKSLILSIGIAFTTTLFSVLFAIITAFALRYKFKGKRFITFLYHIPITVPHIVVGIGVLLLFSQSGLISRFISSLGIINNTSEFPILVNDKLGIGIILVYLWINNFSDFTIFRRRF